MTGRDRIANAASFKPTDRVSAALLSGGSWALYHHGLNIQKALLLEPEDVAEKIFSINKKAGVDIIWAAPSFGNILIKTMGGEIKFREKGPPDVTKALINNAGDLERIDLKKNFSDPSLQKMREITRLIADKARSEYAVGASMWGPFTMLGLLYGVEKLMRDLYKKPGVVRAILEWTANLYLEFVDYFFIGGGVNLVSMGDPAASGDMISRRHFEDFALPLYNDIYARLRKENVITCLHICGNIENRLDLISLTGVSLVSIDYKVNIKKAREILGRKTALAGNINPVGIIKDGTAEDIIGACEQCIAEAGEDGGFILMPGCDIPPTTPFENVKTMTETAAKHRFKRS
ncbi:MAG: uroporphyrinogen decarboxylase family protein [Treponema sp.]|jgi:uroporphyrinogen decarboxylase|nr:uroporphyrinogen decarboxylase family protein [Treponema sp.]